MALSHASCVQLLGGVRSPVCRGVLAVMYGCGLRLGEAVKIRVTDVNGTQGVLRVVGKGDKERLAPLSPALLADLRRMWTTHRHRLWLFGNTRGSNHIDAGTVRHAFSQARDAAGIEKTATPHCLRHSFATRLLEQGVPAETVRILLGHASLRTTQTYLHLTEPTQRRVNQAVSRFDVPLFK